MLARLFQPKKAALALANITGWLVFAFSLAWLSWAVITWLYPAQPYLAKSSPSASAQALWASSLNNYFISQAQVIETNPLNEPLEKSRLPISVQGVVFSNQANRSVALLKYQNKFLTLVEGEELAAHIYLVKINADTLVFNNQGQLEEISFNLEVPDLNLGLNSGLNLAETTSNDAASQPREITSEERLGTRVLEDTFGANFKESLLKDPLQLMSYITLIPENQDGKLKGFRLQAGVKPELFNHFELKANDLLLAVDGIEVSNTQQMLQLTNKLAEATSLSVDLQRGDEIIRKYLDIE